MKSGKNKKLKALLEICLYTILITGIVFALKIYDLTPPALEGLSIGFIILHKILGYVFLALILWHALIYWKWYKAWGSGKMKNNKNNSLTKSISVLFLLVTFSLFFEDILPQNVYLWGHICNYYGMDSINVSAYQYKEEKKAQNITGINFKVITVNSTLEYYLCHKLRFDTNYIKQ
jgi:hypothetical protein